jgi:hypothetical protein
VEALFGRWREGPIALPLGDRIPKPQGRAPIFSVRPWREEDGDPAAPEQIEGVAVTRTLRTRREARGALVLLADGRLAITGEGLVATGGPRQLVRFCRDRVGRAQSPQAKAWWQEVAGAVLQSSAP